MRGDRDEVCFGKFCAVCAGRRAQHHVQRIHRRVQPCFQHGYGCPNLRKRPFDLMHLQLGGQPLAIKQVDGCQQLLLRLYLLASNGEAGLQPADGDIDIGSLCRHGESGRSGPCLRGLILGQRRFTPTTQAAESVQLPAGAEIGLIGVAVAVEAGRRVQHLSLRRLNRLVGSACLAADRAGG
ncbi:hypothetical protein D3C80_1271870 [compost metagenome]